jgi:pimeloyl-ACP methyl ester carboxylesterase
MRLCFVLALSLISLETPSALGQASAEHDPPGGGPALQPALTSADSICLMIESAARANDLPVDYFARVIWQESRFQPDVVGPRTRNDQRAQGIAQFMPVGQAFVEYQIPQRQTHPFPIVLIHGGSQTGTGWINTPDGREGWAIYFLRHGYAVYVVDQVARGWSAYIGDVYGPSRTQTREYVMQRFWTSEKYNLWPQAKFHTQWPGKGEPGDPIFDNYFASNVPSMENREMQSRMNVDALAALLDRVGPSIVLVHSQSGQYGWPLAQARPALVKAIVAAEPSGPPVHDVVVPGEPRFGVDFASATAVAGTEIFRDDPRLKRYGLSDIPRSMHQP